MAYKRMLWAPCEGPNITWIPVAAATAVVAGDLISVESSAATVMNGATDDATFGGVATTAHAANENLPTNVVLALQCVAVYDCTSAQHALGAGLKWTSANTLVADGGADTIAWAHKYMIATGTEVDALIDVLRLGKLFVAPSA